MIMLPILSLFSFFLKITKKKEQKWRKGDSGSGEILVENWTIFSSKFGIHQNLVNIYRGGEIDMKSFLTMERTGRSKCRMISRVSLRSFV